MVRFGFAVLVATTVSALPTELFHRQSEDNGLFQVINYDLKGSIVPFLQTWNGTTEEVNRLYQMLALSTTFADAVANDIKTRAAGSLSASDSEAMLHEFTDVLDPEVVTAASGFARPAKDIYEGDLDVVFQCVRGLSNTLNKYVAAVVRTFDASHLAAGQAVAKKMLDEWNVARAALGTYPGQPYTV